MMKIIPCIGVLENLTVTQHFENIPRFTIICHLIKGAMSKRLYDVELLGK